MKMFHAGFTKPSAFVYLVASGWAAYEARKVNRLGNSQDQKDFDAHEEVFLPKSIAESCLHCKLDS